MTSQKVLLRKEKVSQKAKIQQSKINNINYEIRDDNIFILSGPFIGCNVLELFDAGPSERDYVVDNLWFTGDPEIEKIIKRLVCK